MLISSGIMRQNSERSRGSLRGSGRGKDFLQKTTPYEKVKTKGRDTPKDTPALASLRLRLRGGDLSWRKVSALVHSS
jgi:hypothetical protein